MTDHPAQEIANRQVRNAGVNLAPWEFDYEASVVVHYYKKRGSDHTYAFLSQLVGLENLPEPQADVGHKELRKALMKAYGREEGRRTDTKDEIL